MKIELASWKIGKDDKGQSCIGGRFTVKHGQMKVAETKFNDGYGSTDIALPATLVAEAEILGEKIRTAVEQHFTGTE